MNSQKKNFSTINIQSFFKFSLTLILLMMISCSSSAQQCSSDSSYSKTCEKTDSLHVIALLGDSMTWIGGDKCEKDTGWSFYLKRAFPDSEINTYARSGATWTNTKNTKGDVNHYTALLHDENVLYNQVVRLINDASKDKTKTPATIILFAGGNDAMFQTKRPGLFEKGKEITLNDLKKLHPSEVITLAESIELDCRLLQQNFPNAELLLITPTQLSKATPDIIHKVSDVIEGVGKKLNIKVLRADNDVDIKHEVEKQKGHKYTYDGVHTNPEGAKLIANFIIPNIKKLK